MKESNALNYDQDEGMFMNFCSLNHQLSEVHAMVLPFRRTQRRGAQVMWLTHGSIQNHHGLLQMMASQ